MQCKLHLQQELTSYFLTNSVNLYRNALKYKGNKKKESWDVFVPVSVYLYCRDTYEKAHSCIWVYIAYTQRGVLYVSIDEKSSLWPHPAHVSTPEPGVLLVPQ